MIRTEKLFGYGSLLEGIYHIVITVSKCGTLCNVWGLLFSASPLSTYSWLPGPSDRLTDLEMVFGMFGTLKPGETADKTWEDTCGIYIQYHVTENASGEYRRQLLVFCTNFSTKDVLAHGLLTPLWFTTTVWYVAEISYI